jgi:uncharacterized protein (TIGR02270 family)
MLSLPIQPIPIVLQQHAEDVAVLRNMRSVLVRAPHLKLDQLRRLDDRLAAHLDGLAVAREFGWIVCEAALERPGAGEVFAAGVRAIEDKNTTGMSKLFALAEAIPDSQRGFISAFGWVSAQSLHGTIKNLLESASAFRQLVGIAACAMNQTDPGVVLNRTIIDADASLRAYSLRAAGECGRCDLLAACVTALADDDAACRFWGASSTALLGGADTAGDILTSIALQRGPFRARALRLALKLFDTPHTNTLLNALANDLTDIRHLIRGVGIAGDPQYVPWLLKQMEDMKLARLAGESFSFITGLDLAYLDLEREPPGNFESGPNDDPNDPNVEMDEDESLPWPDPIRVAAWWDGNKYRFQEGKRYFMGEPPSRPHSVHVLKGGFQRQRIAAAEYLCLLNPGTRLFATSAPAWRQKHWLAKLA